MKKSTSASQPRHWFVSFSKFQDGRIFPVAFCASANLVCGTISMVKNHINMMELMITARRNTETLIVALNDYAAALKFTVLFHQYIKVRKFVTVMSPFMHFRFLILHKDEFSLSKMSA